MVQSSFTAPQVRAAPPFRCVHYNACGTFCQVGVRHLCTCVFGTRQGCPGSVRKLSGGAFRATFGAFGAHSAQFRGFRRLPCLPPPALRRCAASAVRCTPMIDDPSEGSAGRPPDTWTPGCPDPPMVGRLSWRLFPAAASRAFRAGTARFGAVPWAFGSRRVRHWVPSAARSST